MLIMDIVYGLRHQGDKFLMRDLSPRGRPLDLLVWRRSTQPVMVGSSIWRRWRRGGSCRGWSHHPEDVVEEEEAVHVALGHVVAEEGVDEEVFLVFQNKFTFYSSFYFISTKLIIFFIVDSFKVITMKMKLKFVLCADSLPGQPGRSTFIESATHSTSPLYISRNINVYIQIHFSMLWSKYPLQWKTMSQNIAV